MKKILMLGGAYSQVPAIKRAKELGYYVITCDYIPENPGHAFSDEYENISTVDKEKVLEFAKKKQIDGIIAYASDPSAITAAYVSDEMGIPGASFESVKLFGEKDLFRTFQKENGFKVPDFYVLSNAQSLSEITGQVKYPCVVKPVDSSGSKGVSMVDCKEQLEAAVQAARKYTRCGRVIVEAFIPTPYYQLHGDGIVVDGKLAFVALGDQRFRNTVPIGSSLPSRMQDELMENVYREVSRLIACSGFSCGGINIEVRVTEEGEIYIVEIGPRTGGNYVPQLMSLATGEDEMSIVLQMAMGERCNVSQATQLQPCFQYIVGSDEAGYFEKLEIDDYMQEKVVEIFLHKKQGDWIAEYENSSGVVGVVFLKFQNAEEMERDINNIKKHIKVVVER